MRRQTKDAVKRLCINFQAFPVSNNFENLLKEMGPSPMFFCEFFCEIFQNSFLRCTSGRVTTSEIRYRHCTKNEVFHYGSSKCDQIGKKLWIWKTSFFCAVHCWNLKRISGKCCKFLTGWFNHTANYVFICLSYWWERHPG